MSNYLKNQYGLTTLGLLTIILVPTISFLIVMIVVTEHDYSIRLHNILDNSSCSFLKEWVIDQEADLYFKSPSYKIALEQYALRCKV